MGNWKMPGNAPSKLLCGQLPDPIVHSLRTRVTNVLQSCGASDPVTHQVTSRIIDVVSHAYVARNFKLTSAGAGRPPDGPSNLLSIEIEEVLKNSGISGNWLLPGDDKEDGAIGPIAEIEAIAQTAFRQSCGKERAAMARPARITDARKRLGPLIRNR